MIMMPIKRRPTPNAIRMQAAVSIPSNLSLVPFLSGCVLKKSWSIGLPDSIALIIISAVLLVSFCFVLITSQTIATGITTQMKIGVRMSIIVLFMY